MTTYHFRDRFGPLPARPYPRLCDALCTARTAAALTRRVVRVTGGGKFEWVVRPNRQITKRPRSND